MRIKLLFIFSLLITFCAASQTLNNEIDISLSAPVVTIDIIIIIEESIYNSNGAYTTIGGNLYQFIDLNFVKVDQISIGEIIPLSEIFEIKIIEQILTPLITQSQSLGISAQFNNYVIEKTNACSSQINYIQNW